MTSFNSQPLLEIRFLNAGKGPGSFYVDRLPIHEGRLSDLPSGLDALIATADLQGRERFEEGHGGPPRLLGEVLPRRLAEEFLPQWNLSPHRTGILLAGDFYTVPNLDRRGGSGDVSQVWQAFAQEFGWVAGVAGNHDLFGTAAAPARRLAANAHYLDGDRVLLDGLTIAGIGGILGDPRKPQRKTEREFVSHLELIAECAPDLLVMHDGPDDPARRRTGSPLLRQTLESLAPTLVIRGHAHWPDLVADLANGTQVLNVHCRVVILRR